MAILVIASFFLLIQVLNYMVKKTQQESINNEDKQNIVNSIDNNEKSNENSKLISGTSGVGNYGIPTDKLSEAQEIFDKFFEYCNSKNLEKAYEMLTDECKELVYPNLEAFKNNYYNNIFANNKKVYSFENWYNNTYMVTIENDALSSGIIDNNIEKKVDYMTIKENKLNISSYIERTTIDKEMKQDGIQLLINSKDTFMDCEIYNVTILNNTENTICLANVNNTQDIYLVDSDGIKYNIYNHELLQSKMTIKSNYKEDINLKFYSSYIREKELEGMVFSNVYLDYKNQEEITKIYVDF